MPTRKKSPARPNSIAASNGNLRGARAAIDRPIGVFDSGIGGLTVLKELTAALPNEDFIYLGDTARLPYGTKSNEVIVRYSQGEHRLPAGEGNQDAGGRVQHFERGRARRDRVGDDGAGHRRDRAGRARGGQGLALGKIGVIGTEATIASGAYTRAIQRLSPRAEIYTRACPLLVPLVEEGWTDNEVAELTVAHYLESLKQSGIDTLLLGCTHYPLLREMFAKILGPRVKIVDSATATASDVRDRLRTLKLARRGGDGSQSFFVTETPDRFVRVGRRFLGPQVESAVRLER